MNRFLLPIFLLVLAPMLLWAQVDETKPFMVSEAVAFAKSAPLSELAAVLSPDKSESLVIKEVKNKLDYDKWPNVDPMRSPGKVQIQMGTSQSRGPVTGFAGQGGTGYYPPDTDGDVSETHFVQVVNSKYNVYEKDGTKVLGPLNLSTLWDNLPGPWVGSNDGDPIVVYDEEADRWVITQFFVSDPTKYELFAVSETSDPLGAYYLYAFSFGSYMNDYPKIGVWRNAYYATYNMFNGGFTGGRATAVDRAKMLVGDPSAEMVQFNKGGYYSMMPADIDGENLPDEGDPCPIMYINNSQRVEMWDLSVDWNDPNSASLTLGTTIIVSSFSPNPNSWVSQPNTSQKLDGLGGMIMNRLAYRKFENHESMVVNHSVRVNTGSNVYRGAIRWYEFRKTTGAWVLHQEGTYAPDDNHRWMGSAAMNANGDISIAYSVSNSTDIFPSIRYTGRRADDPLGEMTMAEVELKAGTSNQAFNRWGDYSCLNVDPVDDTTFWYTTLHSGWKTWIASYDLGPLSAATCSAGGDGYTCIDDAFVTQGDGTGVSEILWTSDGDGFFGVDDQFNSTYIRGNQDIENGGCTLTIGVVGFDGSTASDSMYLSIVDSPTCNAGDDATIFENQSYTLAGTATHAGEIVWTTSGDGAFSDTTILDPIYSLGPDDILNGGVDLYIHVEPIAPCEGTDDDEMHLGILTGLNELENNSLGLSVFPNPTNNVFTLNIDNLNSGEQFTFFVYTSYGKEIYRQVATAKSNIYERVIDMTQFVPGIYFVKVNSDSRTTTMKVVKK
ncbi:MAG: T9SS type A sorting domain-containing protein [Bacteroidota bacterium]